MTSPIALYDRVAPRSAAVRSYVGERTGRWLWVVAARRPAWALGLKRALDVVGALGLLVLGAPVILLVVALVKLTSPGRVLFVQKRVGAGCREFAMLKFRTMVAGAETEEQRLADQQHGRTFLKIVNDPRVTPVGRFLRGASLDELPQLWNVLRGDMSLVGPRPLLPCDFRKFPRQDQLRRFSMKPGLSGLWQVSGRSALSDEERIALDLRYVDEWNLRLDLAILLRTVPAVLTARGAS